MLEAAGDAARQIADARLEALHEGVRLVSLSLTALHRRPTEQVVQLHRLVRRNALLLNLRVLAKPEEERPLKAAPSLRRLQGDVRVALVELAVQGLGHGGRQLLLDAPHLQPFLFASPSELCSHLSLSASSRKPRHACENSQRA